MCHVFLFKKNQIFSVNQLYKRCLLLNYLSTYLTLINRGTNSKIPKIVIPNAITSVVINTTSSLPLPTELFDLPSDISRTNFSS